jgi:hypothetical protein
VRGYARYRPADGPVEPLDGGRGRVVTFANPSVVLGDPKPCDPRETKSRPVSTGRLVLKALIRKW